MSDDDPEEFDPSDDDARGDDPDPADPFADIDEEAADDPFAELGDDGDDGTDPFADIEGIEAEDDPFTDLDVGDGDPSTDFGPSDNTLFTDEDSSDIDDEAVWEQVEAGADGDGAESPTVPEEALDSTAESGVDTGETVVKKRSYCERCEYFSQPPEVSCSYPGSEIVELVDTGRFRVRNCPIVERRQSRDISSIAGGGGVADPELEAGDSTDPELEAADPVDSGSDG